MSLPFPERAKILATVQNVFMGRFYSADLFMLYRALSGQYYRSPILGVSALGTQVFGDMLQYIGPVPPADRAMAFLDAASIFWNEEVKKFIKPLVPDEELWKGWDMFTRMLQEDLEARPSPPLPGQKTTLDAVRLTDEEYERLDLNGKLAYLFYIKDVEWSEVIYEYASAYFPEAFLMLNAVWPDYVKIFDYYGEWANERFRGITASKEGRIMGKVVLIADYRFWVLLPDFLHPLDPLFQTLGFRNGVLKVASPVRQEAEEIVAAPLESPLQPL